MLSWQDVHVAVKPLRLIFWGGLLCILDLTFSSTTNGSGYRCDVLDDTVGAVLITFGVFRLGRAPVPGAYAGVMRFVKVVAVASIVETAIKHVIFDEPAVLTLALTVVGLCQLAATILFCLAMRWFCEEAGLPLVAGSWRVTFWLFCLLYAAPLAVLYVASLFAAAAGTSFNVNLGPAGLLLIPVFLIPMIHLFVSTSRMRRAAERGAAMPPPGGFPVILPPQE